MIVTLRARAFFSGSYTYDPYATTDALPTWPPLHDGGIIDDLRGRPFVSRTIHTTFTPL